MRTTNGLRLMALLLGTAVPLTAPAFAQDAPAETAAETAVAAGFTAEELDTLLAPIALYPDALLAQVLLATTYPVDVLKADRFLTKNPELDAKARSAMAADQDWPDPIREMTAGFPELIVRMAEHIDRTEQTGGAVIAQTDDVLASVQRLRAQAMINGYLVDSEAMTVAEDPDSGSITISSANPEVVYVPQYTETVYTQPAPTTPVYVTDDDDWDDYLMTGAVVWGSAIILDEIFDDDDWDGGRDHWYGGGLAGFERPTTLLGRVPDRLGEVDSDRLTKRKDGNFKPSDASRDAAREKIAKTKGTKDGVAKLPAATSRGDLGKVKPGKTPSIKVPDRPKKTANSGAATKIAPKKVSKPKDVKRPKTGTKVSTSKKAPVYLPSSGNRGNAASLRGNKSLKGNR